MESFLNFKNIHFLIDIKTSVIRNFSFIKQSLIQCKNNFHELKLLQPPHVTSRKKAVHVILILIMGVMV